MGRYSTLHIFEPRFTDSGNIYIFGILERGNSAIIVCILLLRAMELRERKSPIAQELALLFIAMAAAIKIYPAIFGFIYLRRNGKKLED